MSGLQTLPVTLEEFEVLVSPFVKAGEPIAVALSGGADSLALAWLMSLSGREVHLLHVDHGLRAESAREAESLQTFVAAWPGVSFYSLKWVHESIEGRVQEQARVARYRLMAEHCAGLNIQKLFLAHHQDDQAETVLFRLAKGSGLDGLAGMQAEQEMGGLMLCRPFLDVPKARLLETCAAHNLDYFVDPSNENADFARVRLREARAVLEAEGLSNKRLSLSAKRLSRARKTLDSIALEAYQSLLLNKNTDRIEFNLGVFQGTYEEIALRVLLLAVHDLRGDAPYGPRFEKIEALFEDFYFARDMRKRTLGGVVFDVDAARDALILSREKA